jgi:PAS domain S-box-containing protein
MIAPNVNETADSRPVRMKLLFLCSRNAACSQMAAGFARRLAGSDVEVHSAGIEAGSLHPLAVKVMAEVGIDISDEEPRSLDEVRDEAFNVVVTLCQSAARQMPILPGFPARVQWDLANPADVEGTDDERRHAFRQSRDDIQRLVADLFKRGYLSAFRLAKRCEDLILDNISDGLIAHDLRRVIFHFNRAAETITGYRREDVINRDCHDVFPGNFCGGKCLFCDENASHTGEMARQVAFVRPDGESRLLDTSVRPMIDVDGTEVGVLMTFRDVTREHELARRAGEIHQFSGIIGRDKQMLEIFDLIRDLADTDVPVLVQGESGTGKELVAAAIHNEGPRANRQFVPVNCGALPESLLESELFGHVKGAFTGAIRDKKGRFELADGGTIFLDEIGDISPAMQVKLMRVLQEGTFERVGSETTLKVDVRVISATNKDLQAEIAAGRFRDDLYYRLSVVPVWLPPLRDRRHDIPLIAEQILARALRSSRHEDVTMAPETMDILMNHDWPGNVRELQNWIQFALVKCKNGVIRPEHLPPYRGQPRPGKGRGRRHHLDIAAVREAVARANGNKQEAARLLGVSRATLYRFLDSVTGD